MSNTIRLLNADGTIEELDAIEASQFMYLDGEIDLAQLNANVITAGPLVIEFNGVADGRGFSLAKAVQGSLNYGGRLYAAGFVNPDQLSLAFQTGFHGVLVSDERWEDYGSESWQSALSPIVNLSYAGTQSPKLKSIFQMRHGAYS